MRHAKNNIRNQHELEDALNHFVNGLRRQDTELWPGPSAQARSSRHFYPMFKDVLHNDEFAVTTVPKDVQSLLSSNSAPEDQAQTLDTFDT